MVSAGNRGEQNMEPMQKGPKPAIPLVATWGWLQSESILDGYRVFSGYKVQY